MRLHKIISRCFLLCRTDACGGTPILEMILALKVSLLQSLRSGKSQGTTRSRWIVPAHPKNRNPKISFRFEFENPPIPPPWTKGGQRELLAHFESKLLLVRHLVAEFLDRNSDLVKDGQNEEPNPPDAQRDCHFGRCGHISGDRFYRRRDEAG
jgi:hypothetical protein